MDKVSLDKNEDGHSQRKDDCPSCGKRRRYVRYYNFTKSEYLPIEFGRCDREAECGYFNQPWDYLKGLEDSDPLKPKAHRPEPKPEPKYTYVNKDVFKSTLTRYDENMLIYWLVDLVGGDNVSGAIAKYMVGTAKGGGTIFWQINRYMQVCTGQLVYYADDGHRRKDVELPAKRLFQISDGYTTCLFGEHLLYDWKRGDLIGLVESEKTAFICSIYMPVLYGRNVHWMATCGMNGLTDQKANALRGKDVVLCPDYHYHGRAVWGNVPMRRKKVDKRIIVCADGEPVPDYVSYRDKLESIGCKVTFLDDHPDIDDGSDIADYLVLSKPKPKPVIPQFDFSIKTQPDRPTSVIEQARDSSWNEALSAADRMMINKYGRDNVNDIEYKSKKQSLERQLEMSVDPRVVALARAFDCDFEYNY